MSNQFSPRVSEILSYSREEASRLASSSVGPEHLLLGMMRLKDSPALEIMVRLNIDYKNIKTKLEDRVRNDDPLSYPAASELVLNERASNILKLSVLEARLQHMQKVDEQHLLLAILHDNANNGAKQVLEMNEIF